jgi:hypothetical protein
MAFFKYQVYLFGSAAITYVFECNSLSGYRATTLLDGTNVRLNWNIESDMNVYWI